MFLDFFYTLRAHKVPVSVREYLDLIDVLENYTKNGEEINGQRLYTISRNVLVKDIKFYDAFDLAFSISFKDVLNDDHFKDKLNEWLKKAKEQELSEERRQNALNILPEDIIKELEKRLKDQKEQHDGGNHWIGTGGTSSFGHSGFNPSGIRVGGESKSKSAIAVAGRREYKDYRTDETLNIRQIKVALKKLRILKESGKATLNVEKTIRKTVDNAGEIDIVETKSRKNNLKLVLLMDIGGSMTPHAMRVNKLFSATHQVNHFKEFKHFYFHNIFYDDLYTDASMSPMRTFDFDRLKKIYNADTRFIIVGDAYMAPYELFQMSGNMREYYYSFDQNNKKSKKTGIDRVKMLKERYPKTVWLNPEPKQLWQAPTISAVSSIIPMFHLSVDGLEAAIKELI